MARVLLILTCAWMTLIPTGPAAAEPGAEGQPSAFESALLFAEALSSSPRLRGLAAEPARYRLQIEYAEVVETGDGPELRRFRYRPDAEYWYPASTVKLFAAVAALEAIEALEGEHAVGLSPDTPLVYHPLFEDERLDSRDEMNAAGGTITLRNEIRKTLIVSENRAFNRLYEFVGQDGLDRHLRKTGIDSARIVHRLAESRTAAENRSVPRIDLVSDSGRITIPARVSEQRPNTGYLATLPGYPTIPLGRAHIAGGEVVKRPMAMGGKNLVSLHDLQSYLSMVVRPDIDLGLPGLALTDPNRSLLIDALTDLPSESENPAFDAERFSDDWPHFFRRGVGRAVPLNGVRIANKIGLAYGFLSETAYIEDRATGRGFFLAAIVYVNDNATLNDGVYEYEHAIRCFQDLAHFFSARAFGVDMDTEIAPAPFEHRTHRSSAARSIGEGDSTVWGPFERGRPIIETIASWNVRCDEGAGVRFDARARVNGRWSDWLPIGSAGAWDLDDEWATSAGSVRTDIDILVTDEGATGVQVRATASGGGVRIDDLSVTTTIAASESTHVDAERFAGRVGPWAAFSTHEVSDPSLWSRVCSPLSTRTLLAHRGVSVPADAVAEALYDDRHDLYGVWPNAIQGAYELGVPGYLTRFSNWSQVREHLERVGPIAVSIRFAPGELSDPGYDSTAGHLIVIDGLDENGDAFVLDPAHNTPEESRRVYNRDELGRVWLDRVKGLAYALLPIDEQRAGGTSE